MPCRCALAPALLAFAVLVLSSALAAASPEGSQAAPRGGREERWPVHTVLRLAGGKAFTRGVGDGWYGRAEVGGRLLDRGGGPLLHVALGLEGWQASDGRGGALPVTMQFGYVASIVHLSAGLGVNLVTYDRVGGDGGVGGLSPVAMANVGVTFGPVGLLADVRAQHRWQFGADDRRVYTAGLALELVLGRD